MRLNKTYLVMIDSKLYGDEVAIARNISPAGLEVELPYAPPAGTLVTARFLCPRFWTEESERHSEVLCRDADHEFAVECQVTHHYTVPKPTSDYTESDVRVVNLRFIAFPGAVIASPGVGPIRPH